MAGSTNNVVQILLRVKQEGAQALGKMGHALSDLGQHARRAAGALDGATSAHRAADAAAQRSASSHRALAAGVQSISVQLERVQRLFAAWAALQGTLAVAQRIVALADAWNMMNARLKLATAEAREYTVAQKELFAIAQRIGVPIQETATLYGKLQQAVRMLGGEQQDALSITESISQALRLSGASATEAQSSLLQFGQALASGVLRGEEFNSVVENSPRLAQALADGLNVPIGRLRKLAEEGRLTADVVVNALMSQKDKLAAEYAQLPQTVSQSFERLRNAFGQWVSKVDEATGFTKKLAEALTFLANNLDTVMQWLKRIAEVGLAVLIYRLIPALITAWQTAGAAAVTAATATSAAWATANLSVSAAVASVGLLKTAFAVLGAFLVGWEIGTWLSEKFEIVRKAGIFMVEMLVKGIEHLRFQWEMFAAVFSSDTIAEATKRHEQRLAEMNQIFAQMYADATEGANAAKGAMNTAATAAEEIAKRLEAVRQGTQEAVGRGIDAVHSALEKLKSRLGEVEQAVGKANQTVFDATAKMAEAYKGLTAIVEASLAQQVQAVKNRYEQEKAALDLTQQSETAKITQSTQLLTEALTQQSTLRRQATTETLGLIDQETQARKDAAARQGQTEDERRANVQRVENDILAAKRQTLAQALSEYRQHIDALNAEANRHLAEIKRIEEEKRQLSMTTEERIRDIRRQGMTEFEATEDRKRQIAEYQEKAREALANGELELARQLAQKAMDLAAQVASSQTSEAKRAEEARKQSEQAVTQVTQLEAQSREAYRKQEYAQAEALMRQADQLRAEMAQRTKEAEAQIAQGKDGVYQAIQRIRESEEILNQTLDAEAKAHQRAAQSALSARDEIQRTLTETSNQIDQITAKLAEGLKVMIDADTTRLEQTLAELDQALAEKQLLLAIEADLQSAQKQLQEYEALLKEGKTLPVDADLSKAREALDKLKAYADQNAQVELRVATEKAQTAIGAVESMILALDRIQTESRHRVTSNAPSVRAEIDSLNGRDTSSTHTIYVRRVETRATGGVVGEGTRRVAAFAAGGPVGHFPSMAAGVVPGVGDGDTVPRTLPAGSYVLRKAAVRRYGGLLAALQRFVPRFAQGGLVRPEDYDTRFVEARKLLDWITEAQRRIAEYEARAELAKADLDRLMQPLSRPGWRMSFQGYQALIGQQSKAKDRQAENQRLAAEQRAYIQQWMSQLERYRIRRFASGGAASDTVPAMLTPGEYVVRRDVVARLGVGFFDAINGLRVPRQALAALLERAWMPVRGYASGGLVQDTDRVSAISTRRSDAAVSTSATEAAIALRSPAPSLTVHVHGISDPERLARQIEPHLQQLIRLKAA